MRLYYLWVLCTLSLLKGYVTTRARPIWQAETLIQLHGGASTTTTSESGPEEWFHFNSSIPNSAIINKDQRYNSMRRQRIRNILQKARRVQVNDQGHSGSSTCSPSSFLPGETFWGRRIRIASDKGRRVKSDFRRLMNYYMPRDTLRQLSLNVTEIKRLNIHPVVVFVNRKSGGGLGAALIERLSHTLHHVQICDLSSSRPSEYLALYKGVAADEDCGVRLLCCGGDGTVAWVLQEARLLELEHVSVGVVPLGTGNDLNGVLVEAAQDLLRRRPDLLSRGARVLTNAEEVFAFPEVMLDACELQGSTMEGAGHWNREVFSSDDFSATLDRWSVVLERRGEGFGDGDVPADHEQEQEQDDAHYDATTVGETASLGCGVGVISDVGQVMSAAWSQRVRSSLGIASDASARGIPPGVRRGYQAGRKSTIRDMNNYMGIGVDGAVSMAFAELRRQYPGLFFSQIMNKVWYGLVGFGQFVLGRTRDLSMCVRIMVDNKVVRIPPGTQGIIILNINSYAGGSRLWRFGGQLMPVEHQESQAVEEAAVSASSTKTAAAMAKDNTFDVRRKSSVWRRSSMSDQLLEVVAVNNIAHLGQIRAGLANAVPLAQGTKIEIVTDESLPMQIDGEPFRQRASLVVLDWARRAKMLLPITTKSPLELPSDLPDASDITDAAWCQNYS